MPELLSLPDEVLKLVMKHVPIVERLTSCCLVNRRMHAAAVAATSELRLSFGSADDSIPKEAVDCAFQWLSLYGQHVTSLHLYGLDLVLVNPLPCPNLQNLHMFECNVQLGPGADGTAGIIHGCTKLTCLELRSTMVDTSTPEGAVIDSLSSLVHLQHLSVEPDWALLESEEAILKGLSTATLPSLPHLTYLRVENLSVENLLQLGALTGLQELCLTVETGMPVSPTTCPGLVLPASLTGLELMLSVQGSILSVVPTGLQDLFMECDLQGPAEGPDSLLSCMARLQHLTKLKLNFVNNVEWPLAGPAYSALTASSRLAHLVIHELDLPAGVWQHVFPASHKLLHLTHLSPGWKFPASLARNLPLAWSAADVSSLVSCCPNLCSLVDILLQHGPHVSELHKLSALTHLELQFPPSDAADFTQSLSGVAAITQLKALDLELTQRGVPTACFLPLTSLTALTKLVMCEGRYHGTADHLLNLGTKVNLARLHVVVLVHAAAMNSRHALYKGMVKHLPCIRCTVNSQYSAQSLPACMCSLVCQPQLQVC
jgi:hypothetical protein